MNTYCGTLSYRLGNVGTRSEGYYALLIPEAGEPVRLCREGGAPCNDAWFRQFDATEVRVSGTPSHGWLVVERIERIVAQAPENEDTTKEDSQP